MGRWSQRRLTGAIRSWLGISFLILLLLGVTILLGNENFNLLVTNTLILSTMIVSLQVFIGNSGIVSFGNLAFFATGAYTTAILTIPPKTKATALPLLPTILSNIQLGLLPAVLGGAIAAGILAFVTGIVFTRMKANAMAMATLSLLVMIHTILNNWKAVTRGTIGIYGIPKNVTIWTALLGFIVITGIALLYKALPFGLHLQASREDSLATKSLGIHIGSVRLYGWVLGALLMGAGGSLWAQNVYAFAPGTFFFSNTFNMIAMLIIGGQGSVTGAVTGCFVVTMVGEILRPLESGLLIGTFQLPRLDGVVNFSVALLILIVLIFRPSGLLGNWELSIPNFLKPESHNKDMQT